MASLSDLIAPRTVERVKAALLALLQSRGFPVTDWAEGGVARTLVEMLAQALADLDQVVAKVAAAGFVALSSGDWLTLVAAQVYGLARNLATFTQGTVLLSDAASAGPFTIVPGQLYVQSTDGKRFTNLVGGVLTKGGTLSLQVQAESPGAAFNVPVGAISTLLTPLPGVTVANPLQLGAVVHVGTGHATVASQGTPTLAVGAVLRVTASGAVGVAQVQVSLDGVTFGAAQVATALFDLPGTGVTLAMAGDFVAGDSYLFSTGWITSSGTDAEPDDALRTRCLARWPSLGMAPNQDVYDLWARTAAPVVTRTYERPSPTIPGQADLFLATAAGPADAATVAAVNAFIKPRIPLTSTLSVASASPVTVTAKARLFIRSGYEHLALAQASANLNAYLLSVSIGGTVYLSDLIAALQQPAGIRNVVLDSPTADVVLGETQVATVVQDLSVIPV